MMQSRLAFAVASRLSFPLRFHPSLTHRPAAHGRTVNHDVYATKPKVVAETIPVSLQGDPNFQQKRKSSTVAFSSQPLDSATCAGLDGSPWPRDAEEAAEQKRRDEETETDKEYYSHHKASPLAEIEIADTRKPITQATDGTAYRAGRDVIGWLPEQLDTEEDSLRRATLIFKRNAERGDPETFPHSRILREMRGEWF